MSAIPVLLLYDSFSFRCACFLSLAVEGEVVPTWNFQSVLIILIRSLRHDKTDLFFSTASFCGVTARFFQVEKPRLRCACSWGFLSVLPPLFLRSVCLDLFFSFSSFIRSFPHVVFQSIKWFEGWCNSPVFCLSSSVFHTTGRHLSFSSTSASSSPGFLPLLSLFVCSDSSCDPLRGSFCSSSRRSALLRSFLRFTPSWTVSVSPKTDRVRVLQRPELRPFVRASSASLLDCCCSPSLLIARRRARCKPPSPVSSLFTLASGPACLPFFVLVFLSSSPLLSSWTSLSSCSLV